MQKRVAALNESRAQALQALNTAIIEEEQKKSKLKADKKSKPSPPPKA